MRTFHIGRNGQNLGVFPEDQVIAMLQAGQLFPTDLAWTEGMAQWQPLNTVVQCPASPIPLASVYGDPSQAGPMTYSPSLAYATPMAEKLHTRPIRWKPALFFSVLTSLFPVVIGILMIMAQPQLQQMQTRMQAFQAQAQAQSSGRPNPWNTTGAPASGFAPQPGVTPIAPNASPQTVFQQIFGNIPKGWLVTVIVCYLVWGIFYIFAAIYDAIMHYQCWKALPTRFRATTPGLAVGLMFVPVFNLFWMFYTAVTLAKGYRKWAASLNDSTYQDVMIKGILWRAIPFSNFFVGIAALGLIGIGFEFIIVCVSIGFAISFYMGIIRFAHKVNGIGKPANAATAAG